MGNTSGDHSPVQDCHILVPGTADGTTFLELLVRLPIDTHGKACGPAVAWWAEKLGTLASRVVWDRGGAEPAATTTS